MTDFFNNIDLYEEETEEQDFIEEEKPNEIIKGLYIGDIYSAKNKPMLQSLNIKAIVNATESKSNNQFPYDFEYLYLSLRDDEFESFVKYTQSLFDFIEKHIKDNQCVLVHCIGGVSRSATLVIYYLMRKFQWRLKEAYHHVLSCRPGISPNNSFFAQLIQIEKEMFGSETMTLQDYKTSKRWPIL